MTRNGVGGLRIPGDRAVAAQGSPISLSFAGVEMFTELLDRLTGLLL